MKHKALVSSILVSMVSLVCSTSLMAQSNIQLSGFSVEYSRWGSNYLQDSRSGYSENWNQFGGLFEKNIENSSYPNFGSPFSYYGYRPAGIGQFYFNVNLSPTQELFGLPAKHHSFNIGIGFSGSQHQFFGYSDDSYKRFDTLSSDLGPIYADTVTHDNLFYTNSFSKVSANFQYRLSTDPMELFHFYLAPEISADLYFDQVISAEYRKTKYVQYEVDGFVTANNSDNSELEEEKFQSERPSNTVAIGAALPFGVAWRVSKQDKLLKHTYLFMEGKLGLDYLMMKDFGNVLDGVHGFSIGIRIWGLHLED